MGYLTAAVVLVGLLCLLDLALSLGVIRRLREHAGLLSQLPSRLPAGPSERFGMSAGETVAGFAATTTDGELVSRDQLPGRMLVGFFAPGCRPCAEQLPRFIDHARSMPDGRTQVLAVVAGDDIESNGKHGEYLKRLAEVARVVVEAPYGPVQTAFQVSGYPTLYLVDDDGVVVAGGPSLAAFQNVPAPPAADAAAA